MSDCGDEPKGWIRTNLGEIVPYGKCEKAAPGEMPEGSWLLELEDIEKDTSRVIQEFKVGERKPKSTKNRFEVGDVLYGKLRPYLNKIIVADKPGFCTTEIIPITPPKTVESKFLFFWMRGGEFRRYVDGACHGVNMPRLGTKDGLAAPLLLPPFNEQRRIVAKIEELTARSQNAKQALDAIPPLLERFRQSVLAAAFRGDLTMEWRRQNPEVEPASVLLQRIRQERRRRWEQDYLDKQKAKGKTPTDDKWKAKYQEPQPVDPTGLPELPHGWCWARLEQVTDPVRTIRYGILKPGPNLDAGIPYVKVLHMRGDEIVPRTELPRTSPEIFAKFANAALDKGDILLSIRGTFGRVAIVRDELAGANITQDSARIAPMPGVLRGYLVAMLRGPQIQNYFKKIAKGVAVRGINIRDIRPAAIPIPPVDEQRKIGEVTADFEAAIREIAGFRAAGANRLTSLNQSILAKAFRGELVPQDPNDEPAAALIARLQTEREALKNNKGSARKR